MTEGNSEVKSVICIDKGTIEKVMKDDRIRPLYSQFRTNLENTLVPYKLSGVQVSNFLTAILSGPRNCLSFVHSSIFLGRAFLYFWISYLRYEFLFKKYFS